ncbi:Spherulation-specific family 4-domain-containing protein [Collybia nuda]|uniref:Spherulation-specific family 4-domain-containing protein n=1 Tax=Collybia nuda TaxID=64659 RepID=A0A9P5Y329_9AGAR|nr:Spherulation-specific family 4-domain-containing protein [Collybia nuda]
MDPGPADSCSGWSQVISSISANPQTRFFSIVNPSDGPGKNGSQPTDAYRQCIQRLRPHSNAITLGYINTDNGNKNMTLVTFEIDTYAGWNSAYRPTGIFFDAVLSEESSFKSYKQYATYARDKGFNFIGLDPGEEPQPDYFGIADLVNVYESNYAKFQIDKDVVSDGLSTPTSNQSVWLTNAPVNESYTETISQMVKKGIMAVYISNLSDNESGIPTNWASFVEDVGKANAAPGNMAPTIKNTTIEPSHSFTPSSSSTRAPNDPQATGESSKQPSDHPLIGPIVGGILGGLVIVSILSCISFFIRKSRRKRNYSVTREEMAHPFTNSRPSLENNRPVIREKQRVTNVLGGLQTRATPRWGIPSVSTVSQSAPSTSALEGLSDVRTGLTMHSSLGESFPTRVAPIEPPPTYYP